MAAKWTTQTFPGGESSQIPPTLAEISPEEKFVVLLLYGKNSFGDKIYSYLKITIPNIQKLKEAVKTGQGFNPSDFGTVIAAGKGEPTDAVRAEVSALYQVWDAQKASAKPQTDIPAEKKKWDEY